MPCAVAKMRSLHNLGRRPARRADAASGCAEGELREQIGEGLDQRLAGKACAHTLVEGVVVAARGTEYL